MDEEMKRLLERGVAAIERLAEEPEIQVPAYPAVCPNCSEMNPVVRVEESEGTGRLGSFVIKAVCLMCNKTFYGLPMQWISTRTLEEAAEAEKERAEISGYVND